MTMTSTVPTFGSSRAAAHPATFSTGSVTERGRRHLTRGTDDARVTPWAEANGSANFAEPFHLGRRRDEPVEPAGDGEDDGVGNFPTPCHLGFRCSRGAVDSTGPCDQGFHHLGANHGPGQSPGPSHCPRGGLTVLQNLHHRAG